MQELIIKRRDMLHFPEEYTVETPPENIDKISIHFCSKSSFTMNFDQFPHLKYIEIIGSRYITLRLITSRVTIFRAIHIANCDYIDIGDISGDFPDWELFSAEYCRYLKFKGIYSGFIMLKALELLNVPNSTFASGTGKLCNLSFIRITHNSHFFKLNLGTIAFPKLEHLWIEDSNYTTIENLGDTPKSLKSFRFLNCVYPKFNLDLSKLPWNQAEPGSSDYEGIISQIPKIGSHFRRGKKIAPIKRRSKLDQTITEDESENSDLPPISKEEENIILTADLDLYRKLEKKPDPYKAAELFLSGENNSESEKTRDLSSAQNTKLSESSIFQNNLSFSGSQNKFCPVCGNQNPAQAVFCAKCGNSFDRS